MTLHSDRDDTSGWRASRAPAPSVPAVELSALQAAIAGTIITPGMPDYEGRRTAVVAGLPDVRPLAIVACQSAGDVAQTLALARRFGVRAAPRSGGHCFAGRSTTEGIVLDVGPMHEVSVSDGLAVVGAGTRLDALYDALDVHGRTLPAGCGPTVGIAGLTLGGGLGILGRSHGLTCDSLLAAQVVLADGRIVHCDADHHPDLFWGLRGAGGGQLGVVTTLTFRTLPAPTATAFDLRWPQAHAAAAIDAWQRWAPDAPDTVDATLRISAPAGPAEPPAVHLVGATLGPASDAMASLEQFVARIGADPGHATHRHAAYRDVKRWLADTAGEPQPPQRSPIQASKSELFRRVLPPDTIDALVTHLATHRAPGQARELAFTPLGGAYNRVPPHATAFAHRHERFLLEHTAVARADRLGAARAWARRSHAITQPWGSGHVYPNFPDRELANWPSAYHGDNYARLRRVKRHYDPDTTFRFHQSL